MPKQKQITLSIGDKLYYHGLGYGSETFVYNLYLSDDGIEMVHANNGCIRRLSDVLSGKTNLYANKDFINKKLSSSYMASQIK